MRMSENNTIEDNNLLGILQEQAKEDVDDVSTSDDTESTAFNVYRKGLDKYTEFEDRARKKGDGYKVPGFPEIEKQLEGVEAGLYILAGESNSGKTAVMMNIVKAMASCPKNKLFGIYFSLDDSSNEIIPRIIAMEQEIPIGVAAKPRRYEKILDDLAKGEQDQEVYIKSGLIRSQLDKRSVGLRNLRNEVDKFIVEDSSVIKNTTDIVNYIVSVKRYLKTFMEEGEEPRLVVAVDALNDIQLDKKVYGNMTKEEKIAEAAKFLKQLTVDFDIPVFTSSHLRKLNGNRRPTVDDLRDSNTLLYEGSVVWLVFNDVSRNKGAASVYWEDRNAENNLGAVIELDWGKNKKSSYKGRTFYWFYPYYSKVKEVPAEQAKAFENIVYQNA